MSKKSTLKISFIRVPFIPVKQCLSREILLLAHLGKIHKLYRNTSKTMGDGRVERRCWVNFQCLGVLLAWITVGQGPIVLAVGAGGGCLDIFSLIYHSSFLSPSHWKTVRYKLKYCLKEPLSPKQPTNHLKQWHTKSRM